MPLTTSPWTIIRWNDLKCNPQAIFIFGDNLLRRGMGGQAKVMRGWENSLGLPTKRAPGMKEEDFFTSGDLQLLISVITPDIERIYKHLALGEHVIWPQAGIGTGRAQLPERAPAIWNYYLELKSQFEQFSAQYPTIRELR